MQLFLSRKITLKFHKSHVYFDFVIEFCFHIKSILITLKFFVIDLKSVKNLNLEFERNAMNWIELSFTEL